MERLQAHSRHGQHGPPALLGEKPHPRHLVIDISTPGPGDRAPDTGNDRRNRFSIHSYGPSSFRMNLSAHEGVSRAQVIWFVSSDRATAWRLLSGSESQCCCDSLSQVVFGHRGVHLDHAHSEALCFPVEAIGEHSVTIKEVTQGPVRVAGLAGDLQ